MNLGGGLSGPPGAQVDIRDPRIRYTFVDVAMKLANDGPMYLVLVVILVLSLRGNATTIESVMGMAIALLARSKPPEGPDKSQLLRSAGVAGAVLALVLLGHVVGGSPTDGAHAGDVASPSVVK